MGNSGELTYNIVCSIKEYVYNIHGNGSVYT